MPFMEMNSIKKCPSCSYQFKPTDGYNECDNSCDTYDCRKCGEEFYIANNISYKGHNPQCGIDSEDGCSEDNFK